MLLSKINKILCSYPELNYMIVSSWSMFRNEKSTLDMGVAAHTWIYLSEWKINFRKRSDAVFVKQLKELSNLIKAEKMKEKVLSGNQVTNDMEIDSLCEGIKQKNDTSVKAQS
jgi:hypothetical protein